MKRIDEIELDKKLHLNRCQKCGLPTNQLIMTKINWGGKPPTELHIDLCKKCHEKEDKHQ
tara:strand:- start:15 stop:194 length:180 start_codon:yes stop_codon:yes gene_type:complete